MTEDRALVAQFERTRSESAFRELYRRHTPYLYGLAYRLAAAAPDSAEDLVEETWLRAIGALDTFGWRSRLRSWLAGILVNCHREQARRAARTEPGLAGDAVSVGRADPDPGVAIDLERLLARLADGYREVVVLHHVYGYTHAEIGELLGISEGTSKSQLARGLARLREWYPDAEPTGE